MGVGLAIASASVIVAALVGVYLAVTLTAAIRSEEAFLTGQVRRSRIRRIATGRGVAATLGRERGAVGDRAFSAAQASPTASTARSAGLAASRCCCWCWRQRIMVFGGQQRSRV